ncbi:RNA polymerase sigma factor RpoE [Minicystis rosea]|nr:RNA polymerase sigma factor RpoE [Minicystis rosea]
MKASATEDMNPSMGEEDPGEVMDAAALYRAHAGFVATFLARLGAPRAELDDLLQEVFLVAHRRGGHHPGPARPTTWLAQIALRVLSNARRTRRRKPTEGDDEAIALVAAADDPFEAAASSEALRRVEHALSTLDLDHRAVFVLFELEGESCESIAAGLGIPVGTVYSRLHHARRRFQKAYEKAPAEMLAHTIAAPRGAT